MIDRWLLERAVHLLHAGELVIVDLRKDGWQEAHEGRTRPEHQYINAWQLGHDHWALLFPQSLGDIEWEKTL